MARHDGGPEADVKKAVDTVGWEKAWQEGATPWAPVRVKPPLEYILQREDLGLPKCGKALVPGCGRGDDVVILARLGFDALGIDSSPTAIKTAEGFVASLPDKNVRMRLNRENFFTWVPQERFQFIYDYTFFCAIPPSLRVGWGESMKRVIAPGGFLATLVFPIDGDRKDGPPFSVSVDLYRTVLKEPDWELVLDEVPPELAEHQVGLTRIALWKSKNNENE